MGMLDAFGGGDSESQDYLKKALQQFEGLQAPSIASETVSNLPMETTQGAVTPEKIDAAQQGGTEFNNIALDPATRAAQISALGGFQDIAGSGGLDAKALLGIKQAEDAANAQNAGMQGAILDNAKATGNGGSNATLTQRLLAAQNSSNMAANAGMEKAAEAEQNREMALANMSKIGGDINASDFGQAATKAGSQDEINARNAAAENAARAANAASGTQGQEFNIENAEGVNARNTDAKRGNAYYNAQLPQQQFNNLLAKAQGAAGVNSEQAGAAQNASNNRAAMTGELIGAGGTVAGAYLGGPKAAPKKASDGGIVPGEAEVLGDSEKNDTQPILASPGELVIPRSVPKDGKHMEEFARHAPVAGDPARRVNLIDFMKRKKAA